MPKNPYTASDTSDEPRYLALAREAILSGLTQKHVISGLHRRIRRDERYLAYRKTTNRQSSYDEQLEADLRVLALAICYLEEPAHADTSSTGPAQPPDATDSGREERGSK